MKRNDEVFCKLRFHKYIANYFSIESIDWEDVPIDKEPPDFYLHLDSEKFAVEVTDLIERINVGTARTLPHNVVISFMAAFVKRVEKEAEENNWLSGAYTVGFHQIIKNFKQVEASLREQVLCYIRSTNELEKASESHIFIGEELVCSVYKNHNKKDIVYPSFPAFAKWEAESTQKSFMLLEERLKDKKEKLRNLSSPIILLILDTNLFFPNNNFFYETVPLLPGISRFHTVFIVSPSFGDFLLYSKNKEWH